MYSFTRLDTDPIGTTPQQSFTNYMTSLYAHINSAEDQELATRAKRTFGDIPPYTKEQNSFIGRAIVSNAGYIGDPFSYLRNNNIPIPENTLTEYELYNHIGKEFAAQSRAAYTKARATAAETLKQQEKAILNGFKTIPAILAEHRLPTAKETAELTNAGLGDRLHKAYTNTLEALDTTNSFNPVTQQDIDAEIINLKSKERQDYLRNNKFAGLTGEIDYTPRHDDSWYQQQAIANKQQGYKLTRPQMQAILTALRDEDGKLDPLSISLFVATLNEKVNKEQTIDSAFWRNVAQGAADYITDSTDLAVREHNSLLATAGTYLGADGEYHIATPEQITAAREWMATYGSKEIETLRAGLNAVHSKAFEASPDSSWINAVLTGTAGIIGREAIPLAATAIATRGMAAIPAILTAAATGTATRYPSIASSNISQAYADNKPNAHAYALIASAPESAIEGLFNAAAAGGPLKKGLEYLGTKALSVPLLAQTAGVIQSSALLRYTSASLLESVGELFIEDPAATLTNTAIFNAINKLAGRNLFAAPGWSDVQKAITSNTDNPRQATYIIAYSFLLGAFGFGRDAAKAHQFALNSDNLRALGYSQTAATEISSKAENISEQLAEIARNPDLTLTKKLEQRQNILDQFTDWQNRKLNTDILNAKFEDLRDRYKANHLDFLDKTQATLAIETGAADAILKKDGIIHSELSPTGNRLLTHTYEKQNASGVNEIKTETIELNPTQYLNYIAARTTQQQRTAITAYQNALLGNAAVRKARTTTDITHDLINLKDLAPVSEAYAHIANKGLLDYQGTQLIAQAVAAKRDQLIASGLTLEQANATADPTTGATISSLTTLPAAFQNRVQTAAATTEGKALGITDTATTATAALRLPSAKSLGDSVILYAGGDITLSELTEELVESDLEKAIASGTPLTTIRDNLLHVQNQLRQYNPDLKLLPSKNKENLTRQDIIEAYSTLQTIDIIHRADRLPLTDTARTIIQYTLGQTELARATRVLGDAWATYANSEAGQTYLTTTGKTLSDLLDTAGISQSKLYADLRVAEEDRIAVETAQNFNPISSLEQQQKNLDRAAAAADHTATTNTQAGLPRTEIPAEESITGQPLTVDPLETADNDPTTAQYTPSPLAETTTDPSFISPATKSPFGITTGMIPPANLKPHPALATTPPITAADPSPQYNPNAKPILALRMPDGSHLIVSGRTRHQIALADPTVKAVKTSLIDYDPSIHTDDWVLMTNAGEHIINRTATTEHYRTYFTLNPITHAQAIEQGLVPIDPTTRKPTAAYTKGRQEAEHTLAAKAEAAAAAASEAAAAAKAQAEKTLPGQTKWNTPSPKSKPLSEQETKQTLISVAALGLSKYKNDRFQFTHTLTQRKNGTEYTVATDGRRLTVISTSTYKEDTDDTTQEWHSSKGEKSKEQNQAPRWTQVIPGRFRGKTSIDLSYYSFLGKGLKGPAKDKHIDSPLLNNNQFIVVNATNGFLSLNPIYVRDAYKQIVELGKKFGFSPIVKLQYNDVDSPVMFSAEHNGIKWQYVLMPVHRTEKATPGDIILGEQPTIYGQQDTGSFSLRRSTVRNAATLMNERETTLLRVANYIKREATRTANIMGRDTELQRAGVAFAQANAIINALDTYIFPKEYITKNSEEYRRLRALRNYLSEYIHIAAKGKLPVRRTTKDGHITIKAAIRDLLEKQLPTARETAAHTIEKKGGNQLTDKELTSELISRLANENATQVIAAMLETAGDIIQTHLRNSILDRITTSLKNLRPKTNPYGRTIRNTINADTQYHLGWIDTFLNLTKTDRATWEQSLENTDTQLNLLRELLETNTPTAEIANQLPAGAVRAAYSHLASRAGEITLDRIQAETQSLEYTFQTYAYLDSGTYIDALRAFLDLNNLVRDSRHTWDTKLAEDRAQRDLYITEAISAIGESQSKYTARSRKKKNPLGSFFDPLMSSGQLFDALSGMDGFKTISRHTVIRLSNASVALLNAQKETEHALVDAWLRIFEPTTYASLPTDTAQRTKAIRKHLERGYNKFIVDMQKEIDTHITLQPELAPSVKAVRAQQGDTAPQDYSEPLILSKGQILNILLTAEQPEYRKNMHYHGYTEEIQTKLRNILGEDYLQFGYAMRDLLINSGAAEVYAERTGHNLPDNPYYWPAAIDHITHTKGETRPDDNNNHRTTAGNNFLKRRVVSMGEIKAIDALTVFHSNMAARMNYIHMQPIADTWNSVLANPHFAHRLEATIGDEGMHQLRTALAIITNSAAGDTQLSHAFAKFCATAQSARAIALLSGNLGTLIRQLTAVNHIGMQLPSGTAAYAKALLLVTQGKTRMTIAQMMRTPTFQARMQGNKYYEELLREGADASWNKLKQTAKNITGLGMDAIAAVDAAANALSATVLYNIRHDHYTNTGATYTEQEIHELCMQDINIMLELCAQPLLQHQKSLLMATTTNALVKSMGFMATEMLNKFGYARAQYIKAGGGWKGLLAYTSAISPVGIPSAIIAILLTAAADDIPDDEIDKWAWITSNAIQGITGLSVITNLPLLGDYINSLVTPGTYSNNLWENILPDPVNTYKHYGELLTMMTTNNSWSNAELAKTVNKCTRDTSQLAAQVNTWLPFLKGTTSTVSAVANALAAGSNIYAQSYNLTAWTRGDKHIPGQNRIGQDNTPGTTRKKAYRQSILERGLSTLFADDNYQTRKARAKRERSRHTRRENRKAKQQTAREQRQQQP